MNENAKERFPFRNVTPEEQRQLSLEGLIQYIQEDISPYSPYYRRLFNKLNIDPFQLSTYDDVRKIPLTYKEDIVANLNDFTLQPSFAGRVSHSNVSEISVGKLQEYQEKAQAANYTRNLFVERTLDEKIYEEYLRDWQPIHFQMSGGTTGKSIITGYTYSDLHERFSRTSAWWYSLIKSGSGPTMRWLNLMPASPHLGIFALSIIPLLTGQPNFNTFGGKVMPTRKQILLAAEQQSEAIAAIPSYLIHWLRTALQMKEEGVLPELQDFKAAVCAGEPMTPSYRNLLRELFAKLGSPNVSVIEGMSSTELRSGGFYECDEGTKLHLDPETFFFEILDPETKEPVAPGQPGIFVWSHIGWHGTAILRYWTGDYVSGGIVWDQCTTCKLIIPRLITPIWRYERDFTKIRGTLVDYVSLQDAIRSSYGVDTFQVVIDKEDASDPFSRDCLKVHIATKGGNVEKTRLDVANRLKEMVELTADEITFETPQQIEAKLFSKKLKAEWIVDKRIEFIQPTNKG